MEPFLFVGYHYKLRETSTLVQAFKLQFPLRKILSNAVRINRTERVFTASKPQKRPSHYTTRWRRPPSTPPIFFCSRLQKPVGPLNLPLRQLWKALGGISGLCRDCEVHIALHQHHARVKTMQHLGSVVVGAALLALRKKRQKTGSKNLDTWEWLKDECLRVTTPVLPAVLETNGQRHSSTN